MKDKIGSDPQNLSWVKDRDRFGYRMLATMGWSEGKGLGVKEDGITKHVKAVKRQETLGLGADINTSNNWLANTSAYNVILSRLNSSSSPDIKPIDASKITESASTNRHIRYHKLVKAKTLANHSSEDISAILVPQQDSDEEDEISSSSLGQTSAEELSRKRKRIPTTDKQQKMTKQKEKKKPSNAHNPIEASSDESDSGESSSEGSNSGESSSDESSSDESSSDESSSDESSSDESSSGESNSDGSSSDSDTSSDESSSSDSSSDDSSSSS